MTKRMLSLLLALVMTLSLCVPALAADEFEAETVTEVVEQAPEAPVEPEAPEAEVVEEPAAEEEAVEAPEVAAALVVEEEEEDLPLLVKLGVVTKEAHWALYQAVEAAEELLPDVQDGTLRMIDFDFGDEDLTKLFEEYVKDPVKNDPFLKAAGDFETVLETAQEYLEGVDGVEVDLTVNTSNVEKAAAALEEYLTGKHALVDDIYNEDGDEMDHLNIDGLKDLIEEHWHAAYDAAVTTYGVKPDLEDEISDTLNVATDSVWTKSYQATYLDELQRAIDSYYDVATAFEVSYADYKEVAMLALDALAQEEEASKPNEQDLATVTAKLNSIPTEEVYNARDYVLDIPWATLTGNAGPNNYRYALSNQLADKTNSTKDFKPEVTLYNVNEAMRHLNNALVEVGNPTIQLDEDSVKKNGQAYFVTVDITVTNFADSKDVVEHEKDKSVPKKDGENYPAIDGHEYGVAWHVQRANKSSNLWYAGDDANGGEYVKNQKPADEANSIFELIGDFSTKKWTADGSKWKITIPITATSEKASPALNQIDDFRDGDTVCIHFYEKKATTNEGEEWVEVGYKDFVVHDPGTATPTYTFPDLKEDSAQYVVAAHELNKISNFNITAPSKDTKLIGKVHDTLISGSSTTPYFFVDVKEAWDYDTVTKNAYAVWLAVVNENEDTVGEADAQDGGIAVHAGTSGGKHIPVTNDAALKAGKYKVEVRYCPKADYKKGMKAGYKVYDSEEFEIKPMITAWKSSVNAARIIINFAAKLVETDYETNADGKAYLKGSTEEARLAGAFDTIETAISNVKALISDRTAGNTVANHKKVIDGVNGSTTIYGVGDILELCSYIEQKLADTKALADAFAEAEKMVGRVEDTQDEGTPVYTFNTYGKLKETMHDAKTALDACKLSKVAYLQHEIDALTAELKADMAALVEIDEIDKTELEAAVKAAGEYKEADYTAASWKILKDALATANKVLAKANPTQPELTNAAKNLNAAIAGLVKTDAAQKADAKAALEEAIKDAETLKEADYTAETWKVFKAALDAAKAITDTNTKGDMEAATKALADAKAALKAATTTPVTPEIPAAPASGTGWVHASDGTWYYYKDKVLQKSKWIYGKGGLWYYVDADAKMLTGFHKIGDAWFMLQTGTEGGVQGKLLSGWINDPAIPGKDAYARTDRNSGHFGEITWTAANGDFVNGHFTKGDPAA